MLAPLANLIDMENQIEFADVLEALVERFDEDLATSHVIVTSVAAVCST